MAFLGIVLIVVFIATAVLLVGVILIQDEQGEGLGGIFGGGSATPFGSRSGNVLTRFTTILGAIFLFCAFGIAWVNRSTQSGDVLAAAKRAEASQSTAWWNASVSSNQTLTSQAGGASKSSPASTSAASSGSSTSAAAATASGGQGAATGSAAPSSAQSSSQTGTTGTGH